jgi:hypothetical protein
VRIALPVLAAAVAAVAMPSAAPAARGVPPLCPGGRYLVAAPPLVTAEAAAPGGTLEIAPGPDGPRVSLGEACRAEDQRGASLTRRRRGSRLAVRWKACAGVAGPVRLRGVIHDGCAAFTGTLRGRGVRLRLDAARASVVCGDGLVDVEEPCDPRAAAPGCVAGQGCRRAAGRCACAPLCAATRPTAAALEAALRAALAAEPDALRDAAAFDRVRGTVQDALGCALNAGGPPAARPDPLPAPGAYDATLQYCGPGDSAADWRLALLAPEPCLNAACWQHDGCVARGDGGCDAALLAACAACDAGALGSWLAPDSHVFCAALRLAAEAGLPSTTTTTSVVPTTLPGPTTTSTSTTAPAGPPTTTPVPTTSTAPTASTAPPTVTTTSSSTSTTASAVGKDLIPENVVLEPDAGPAGSEVAVTWDVANRGTVAVSENWCDKLWLSADAALDAGDRMVGSQCHFGIYAPGAFDRRTVEVTIPADAPPGPAHVLVETDVQATVAEGDEANNVAGAPLAITAAP